MTDDLEEITDKRNAEIRAWGKQVLADADVHLLTENLHDSSDWDLIDEPDFVVEQEITPPVEPEIEDVIEEPVEAVLPPALQEQIEKQIADVESGAVVPKPRARKAAATS